MGEGAEEPNQHHHPRKGQRSSHHPHQSQHPRRKGRKAGERKERLLIRPCSLSDPKKA